jgi:hypothetical protein
MYFHGVFHSEAGREQRGEGSGMAVRFGALRRKAGSYS